MSGATDAIRFLSRSENRTEVLRVLGENSQLDRYAIEEHVEASRRTVIRTLEALAEQGYIEELGDGYQLTALGSLINRSYQQLCTDTELARRLNPFLANVSDDALDLDPRALEDADIVTATEASPYSVLDRTLTMRRNAQQIREIAPMIEQKSLEQLAQRVHGGELIEFEVIIPEAAMQAGGSNPDYQNMMETISEAEEVDQFIHPGATEVFLCIADETVAIGTTKKGMPHALVVTTNPVAKQWADETFERYRDQSARPSKTS